MKFALKVCLGLFACLALVLLVNHGVRAQDTSTENNPAATTASTSPSETTEAQTQTPATTAEQSPNVKAQQMAAECGSMGMMHGAAAHRHWMESHEEGMGMGMMPDHMAMMRMIAHNPRMAGHMLEMRADMMRAVADVMSRYAKQMESGQWQSFQTSSAGPSGDY